MTDNWSIQFTLVKIYYKKTSFSHFFVHLKISNQFYFLVARGALLFQPRHVQRTSPVRSSALEAARMPRVLVICWLWCDGYR